MRTQDRGPWLQTFTGKQFFPLDPRPEYICIEDIAHHLSNLARFTGATRELYTVAQHSVLVSEVVPPEDALAGLLHDASEAYLVDIPQPIKIQEFMAPYRVADHTLQQLIYKRFGLDLEMPQSVKEADVRMLMTERRDLMATPPAPWDGLEEIQPYESEVIEWSPLVAKQRFLSRFYKLAYERAERQLQGAK